MSLVNDALKRATEVQKNRPPTPVVHLPLRPVEPAQPRKTGLGLVLPATLLTIIVAALFSLSFSNRSSRSAPASSTVPTRSPTSGVPAVTAIMDLAPAPLVVAAKQIPVAPPSAPSAPVVMAALPLPAPLRLQAVFYTPPQPSAMINGKMVRMGDFVRELQVVAIGSSSVLLINSTQTNFLTME